MIAIVKPNYWMSRILSEKLIQLHEQGYEFDFHFSGPLVITCLQDNSCYAVTDALVQMIEENFDELTGTYKHMYTVDTCCGTRDLLMMETPHPLKQHIRLLQMIRRLRFFLSLTDEV